MTQPLQRIVIERARALVAKPEAWTRDTLAATIQNQHLDDVTHSEARRFCAVGALMRVAYELAGRDAYEEVANAAVQALGSEGRVMCVNDDEGRRAVLRLFDKWLRKNARG